MSLSYIMRFISALISVYMFVLLIRIFFSYFSMNHTGRLQIIIYKITDPFLDFFRRIPWLNFGRVDFSPALGFILLSIVSNLCLRISEEGRLSIGIIIAFLLSGIFSIISFIINFFIIVLVIRLLSFYMAKNPYNPFLQSIDLMLQPLIFKLNRYYNFIGKYRTALTILLAGFFGINILGNMLIRYISSILYKLPF